MDTLIGNPQVKRDLHVLISSDKLQGTFLFSGPEGIGKSLFAKALIKRCLMHEKTHHPDVRYLQPEGKIALHSMDQIKMLTQEIHIPPFEEEKKFFIIHEAHRMLPTSFNALLKILEEPPSYAVIILITSQMHLIPHTILSRARILSFFPIPSHEIEEFIEKEWQVPSIEAKRVAMLSQGSLKKAQLLYTKEAEKKREILIKMLSTSNLDQALIYLRELEQFFNENEGESSLQKALDIEQLLDTIFYWYRDLHLIAKDPMSTSLFYEEHRDLLKNIFSKPLPSLDAIYQMIQKIHLAIQRGVRLKNALFPLLSDRFL